MDINAQSQLTLPFDQYQRYRLTADIINKFREKDERFQILEVGAGTEENLKKFLPLDDVDFLDQYSSEYEKRNNYIIGDIITTDLPKKYDFTISLDTYEHILPKFREQYINKLINLSKIFAIIAAPFNTLGVKESEALLNEVYKSVFDREHVWLFEHIHNVLPDLNHTLELIKKLKTTFTVIPNGYLQRWFEMMSVCFLTEGRADFKKIREDLFEFYNKNFYAWDNISPAYRQVIIINRTERNIDFSVLISKKNSLKQDFANKNDLLKSFLDKIKDLYRNISIKNLERTNIDLNSIIIQQKSIIEELQTNLANKETVISELQIATSQKESQLKNLESTIQEINSKFIELQTVLAAIYNSLGWVVLIKYRRLKEKIFPYGSRQRCLYDLVRKGIRIILAEGWKSFFQKFKHYLTWKGFLNKGKIKSLKLNFPKKELTEAEPIDVKASVVIPTKNAGLDFEYILQKLRSQKRVREIEIIIVDSGSTDNTRIIAHRYGARVYEIKPEEFNHGETRNYGASKATGDYLMFMTQDAIPCGDYFIRNIINVLNSDKEIVAATVRQIPRSDADLMALFTLFSHTQFINFNKDKTIFLRKGKLNRFSPDTKRRLAQLDNACTCVSSHVFRKFKFRKISYAEDLDFGLRLINTGHKIAFLHSVAIIHSHNRSAEYYFKESAIVKFILTPLLGYKLQKCGKSNIDIVNQCYEDIRNTYFNLNHCIKLFNPILFNTKNINQIFSQILYSLIMPKNVESDFIGDSNLHQLFQRLDDILEYKKVDKIISTNNGFCLQSYIGAVKKFELLIFNIFSQNDYKEQDFISVLYKIFARSSGGILASYIISHERKDDNNQKVQKLKSFLCSGI